MVTQCTVCRLWFRISREELRAAHGLARCGQCETVFNALATLRHEPPSDHSQPDEPAVGEGREEDDPPGVPGENGEKMSFAEPPARLVLGGIGGLDLGQAHESAPTGKTLPWIRRVTGRLWTVAAVVAFVGLAMQLAQAYRRQLVRLPLAGPVIATLYRAAGVSLSPRLVLARYRLSHAALIDTAGYHGRFELTVLLENEARFAQALPIIALRLTGRRGQVVGSRLLAPPDYGARAQSVLSGGHKFRVNVKLADPGPSAVGFNLTLCKHRNGWVYCEPS